MSGESGPLLKISAAAFPWGVPLGAIERVTMASGTEIDDSGSSALIHDDEGPVPIVSLERSLDLVAHQRILWLRHEGVRLALVVDEVSGHMEEAPFHSLPALPFHDQPPISGLAGSEGDALPVLDLKILGQPTLPLPPPPPAEAGEARDDESRAGLMLLPALAVTDSESLIVPALSVAQVLGFESAGEVIPLPGLPSWCLGLGWWRGAPVGVFDLARRLSEDSGKRESRRRWLLAAIPGGGYLALALDGSCSPAPLPDEAVVVPAQGPLADSVFGLFQLEGKRLALLDLKRWQSGSLS